MADPVKISLIITISFVLVLSIDVIVLQYQINQMKSSQQQMLEHSRYLTKYTLNFNDAITKTLKTNELINDIQTDALTQILPNCCILESNESDKILFDYTIKDDGK